MKIPLITALVILGTVGASANEQSVWVGVDAGVGSSHYNSASDNIDTSWTGSINIGKNLSPNWQVAVGLHTGSGTSVPADDIGVATEVEEKLSYSALSIGANWLFKLSTKHALYASAGINYNQTDVELHSVKTIDESGVGYLLKGGWRYNLSEQYAFNLGYQRLGLSDVDVNSANIGFSYRF